MRRSPLSFIFTALLLVGTPMLFAADSLNVHAIQVKTTERYEELIRRAVSTYFRNDAYLLTVKVKLDAQKIESAKSVVNAASADAEEARLPDLPIAFNAKEYGKLITDTLSTSELDQYVESITVRLTIDESYGEKAKEILARTIQEAVDPEGKRKDTLLVERAQIQPGVKPDAAPLSLASDDPRLQWYRLFSAHQNLLAVFALGFFLMMGMWTLGRQVARRPVGTSDGHATAPTAASTAAPEFGALRPEASPTVLPALSGPAVSAKGANAQIHKVAQEQPQHAASVVRGFLTSPAARQAVVQFLQELPLDAAKAVASHMSPREATQLVNGIGDREGSASAADVADALARMQAAVLAQELSPSAERWDFLGTLAEEDIKELVQEEDVEGKALVLFHLPATRASQVYGILGEEE